MKTQVEAGRQVGQGGGVGQPRCWVAKGYLAFAYVVERIGQVSWGVGCLCRTTFMSMPPLQSRRVTLALGVMLLKFTHILKKGPHLSACSAPCKLGGLSWVSAHVVVLWLHVSCNVYKTGTLDGEGMMLQGTKQCLCSSEAS